VARAKPALDQAVAGQTSGVVTPVLIVGIGNEYRRDDAVGLVVARILKAHNLPGVTVVETSDAGAGLLEIWENAGSVVLVDAVRSGGQAGALYRFDAHRDPLPAFFAACSSHAFGVAGAVQLAHLLQRLPLRLLIFGIEGKEYAIGEGLSAEVEDALPQIIASIVQSLPTHTPGPAAA
jgi:hydrogenase maturation protease